MALIFNVLLAANLSLISPSISGGIIRNAAVVQETDYVDLSDYGDLKLTEEVKQSEKSEVKLEDKKDIVVYRQTKPPITPVELESLFDKYCGEYGLNKEMMKKIANCESHFNSQAVNGPYMGMYQFLASTWQSNRRAMGLDPDPNLRFNAEESIKTTAYKISRDGAGAWPVCGK